MKTGFYSRLALDGIRKNRPVYLPYLLTCAGMVMMFYIMTYLASSPLFGEFTAQILGLGVFVIAFFAVIFLFYSNAFLIRRRQKEFGLYNILGMTKHNIGRVLLWETLFSYLFAMAVGLFFGILFSKLAELIFLNIMGAETTFTLSVSVQGLIYSAVLFAGIFLLLLLVSLARVRLSNPLSLLKSEAKGEKPPKANWVFALLGLGVLAGAYTIAVRIQEPMAALAYFFIAVLMVIAATYLLFLAGSVALCRLLQKSKGFYYKPNHFVSVSGMVYRMKRNGAGLASICILATMVLVTVSTTGSMFFGGEKAMRARYPYDVSIELTFGSAEDCTSENQVVIEQMVQDAMGDRAENTVVYNMAQTTGFLDGSGYLQLDAASQSDVFGMTMEALNDVRLVYFIPLSDYNRLKNTDVELAPDEALIWSSGKPFPCETFSCEGTDRVLRMKPVEELPIRIPEYTPPVTVYVVVLPDWEGYLNSMSDRFRVSLIHYVQDCDFDLPGVGLEETRTLMGDLSNRLAREFRYDENMKSTADKTNCWSLGWLSYLDRRDGHYELYGSLFFLGSLLSIVFLFGAALIIYYKQLSEGYEDQNRYAIMRKVGMSRREIRSSINSQVLTVFFAPLLLAGLHLCFAFPMMQKILVMFAISNLTLLIGVTAATFLIFALFYVLVYRWTAHTYYGIVSGGKEAK